MIRNVYTLTVNDLAVSFKNKTVYLMVFIPLFVFFSLNVVDSPEGRPVRSNIGVVRGQSYPEALVPSLQAAGALFAVTWLATEAEGRQSLAAKTIDGLLLADGKVARAAVLVVVKKDSVKTLALLEGLTQLQNAAEARKADSWISGVAALEETKGLQDQTLPIWVLMMVLLVGFLVVPPQVAEEKEKKLLLGLLQTPMQEREWLAAKVLTGMILTVLPVTLLHLVGRFGVGNAASYLAFLAAGSFCFSSMGVLLGFLCRTQASARALGVVVYLPHLLPSALSDFSTKLHAAAVFVPSYQFFVPVKAVLLTGATMGAFTTQLASLLVVGALCCGAALALLKKRWLM